MLRVIKSKNRFNPKSVIDRDKHGDIIKIGVQKADQPRFQAAAFDKIMKEGIPPWLRM